GTHRRERLPLSVVYAHQQGRLISELDDFSRIRLEILRLPRVNFVDRDLSNLRRIQEPDYRVQEGSHGGENAPADHPGQRRPPVFRVLASFALPVTVFRCHEPILSLHDFICPSMHPRSQTLIHSGSRRYKISPDYPVEAISY